MQRMTRVILLEIYTSFKLFIRRPIVHESFKLRLLCDVKREEINGKD